LARSGAIERAKAEAATALQLAEGLDLNPALQEDLLALVARVAKDHALRGEVAVRTARAATAAHAYETVFERLGRPYACVNAATMWYLAGDVDRARALAARTIELVEGSHDGDVSDDDRYWALVTRAEAHVVLGAARHARAALAAAGEINRDDLAARATTRRQLRILCDAVGLDPNDLLEPLSQPEVLHYTGHMVRHAGERDRLGAEDENRVLSSVTQWTARHQIGFAYGSLACGADILIAEAALNSGAELHVVLPFSIDEFIDISVRPGGVGWEPRFRQCLAAASSVSVVSESAYGGDDVLFAYASQVAMGRALNRATGIDAVARQLAVWDGVDHELVAGTASDVRTWRAAGGVTDVISVPATKSPRMPRSPAGGRHIRSVLFGDFTGFSRLLDEQMGIFVQHVMSPLARTLDSFGDDVLVRNTWGDGLFLVIEGPVTAAHCALALQETLSALDMASIGLPHDMVLRLAGHAAPVIDVFDPIVGRSHVMGRELTRAARIEPRTPPGEVYVTSAFAALLALDPAGGIVPEYVGTMNTAKDFETIPLFALRRTRHP